jgi:putative endonuclease
VATQPSVYILRCHDGSLYTGAAKDLVRRIAAHQAGTASKYTRSRRPVRLIWSRRMKTWRRALQVERLIKQLSRAQKLALVALTALAQEERTGAYRHPQHRRSLSHRD